MKTLLTAAQIGTRWSYHRTTAVRIMQKFGYAGVKKGSSKQSSRRFFEKDVVRVESLMRSCASKGETLDQLLKARSK